MFNFMSEALNIFNVGPTYHMFENFRHGDSKYLEEIADASSQVKDGIFRY